MNQINTKFAIASCQVPSKKILSQNWRVEEKSIPQQKRIQTYIPSALEADRKSPRYPLSIKRSKNPRKLILFSTQK